jgi:hypothetical protein
MTASRPIRKRAVVNGSNGHVEYAVLPTKCDLSILHAEELMIAT